MITIEEVKLWVKWFVGEGCLLAPNGVTDIKVARLAIYQHEEIERLRAALQDAADCFWNNSLNDAARKADLALKSGEPK